MSDQVKRDFQKAVSELKQLQVEVLYLQVASKLAGRFVELRWEKPFIADTRAIALRDGEKGLIFIKPDLEPEQKFRSFCHECSHERLHFPFLSDIKNFTAQKSQAPAPHRLTKKAKTDPVFNRNEEEARELADKWLAMVDHLPTVKDKLEYLLKTPDL